MQSYKIVVNLLRFAPFPAKLQFYSFFDYVIWTGKRPMNLACIHKMVMLSSYLDVGNNAMAYLHPIDIRHSSGIATHFTIFVTNGVTEI